MTIIVMCNGCGQPAHLGECVVCEDYTTLITKLHEARYKVEAERDEAKAELKEIKALYRVALELICLTNRKK